MSPLDTPLALTAITVCVMVALVLAVMHAHTSASITRGLLCDIGIHPATATRGGWVPCPACGRELD